MPAAERSVRLTDAYRARLLLLRRSSIAGVVGLWRLDVEDLEATFAAWLARSERLLTATQAEVARTSDAYAAAFVAAELGRPVAPVGLDVAAYAGLAAGGRPLREALVPALYTVKSGIAEGRPFAEAAKLGRNRAVRTATVEVDAAGDQALDEVLEARPEVKGWRRVASSNPCGACLAGVTGRVLPPAENLHRHPHCRCTKEPVVDGARDRLRRPTGREMFERLSADEQNALFAGRGGEAKAELLRAGKIDLEDLSTETRFSTPGSKGGRFNRSDVIVTETPLAELEERARRRSS